MIEEEPQQQQQPQDEIHQHTQSQLPQTPTETNNNNNNSTDLQNQQQQQPQLKELVDNFGGKLALRCWNCQNIHLVKPSWKVIQCPICNAMSKVPQESDEIERLIQLMQHSALVSYADKEHKVPLVNYLVVCPYCKTDNQVRETAFHCVCYKCKNRWCLKKPSDPHKNEVPTTKEKEGNYYKYDSKRGIVYPPQRQLRFSDLFYPDPLFFPGYYPINSISPMYPEYFNPYDDKRFMERHAKAYERNREGYGMYSSKADIMRRLNELDQKVDKVMVERNIPYSAYNRNCNNNHINHCHIHCNNNNNNHHHNHCHNHCKCSNNNNSKVKSMENIFFMKK